MRSPFSTCKDDDIRWAWQHAVIPTTGKLKSDLKFEISVGYVVRVCLRDKQRKRGGKEGKEAIKTIKLFHSTSYSTSIILSFEVQR